MLLSMLLVVLFISLDCVYVNASAHPQEFVVVLVSLDTSCWLLEPVRGVRTSPFMWDDDSILGSRPTLKQRVPACKPIKPALNATTKRH